MVVVTSLWHNIMEIISRAKTMLAVIILSSEWSNGTTIVDAYPKKYFMQAAKLDLVEIVSLGAESDPE